VSAFDAVTRLNLVESLHLHEAAAQAFERAGHQRWLGIELTNAASMRSSMGDYERAHSGVLAALALAARLDLRMPIANYTLGLILAATDRLEAARETLESVLKGTRLDQRADGGVKTLLSRVLVLSGDPASAEIHARAATEITKTLPSIQAYALAGLANALLAQNHVTEACEAARQALEIADSIGSLEDGEAFIRLVHAESLRAAGDEAGAQRAVHVAHERLRICADRIEDLELRSSFLTRIPEHARILELAKTSELRPHH
jgi:tetratricopeptide (TPR) repeat protein